MMRSALIFALAVLLSACSKMDDARTAFSGFTRGCDFETVKYTADSTGDRRAFTLTCAARP